MKHIYIVNESSIASSYGIGTYINHVVASLRDTDFQITVIDLYGSQKEFTVVWKDGVKHLQIPSVHILSHSLSSSAYQERVAENIALILYPHVSQSEQNIFHLNFTKDYYIAKALKKYYKCKIVLTVHCSEWSFQLLGNKQKLLKRLSAKNKRASKIIQTMELERKLMLDVVDNIIAIASHSYNDLLDIYQIPANKITIIRNAVGDKFRLMSESRVKQTRKRFFFYGKESYRFCRPFKLCQRY
ncbi:glycosyltransferase [Alistipes sp. AF48-12]|uniref:glycosyltransferase n=1 Tax=Alistipes sp. AF48-12 TaxID=2291998 RepID=UPI000E54D497|nr:glycosyltransferase [Alistipes sp. AF48-12]